MIWVTEFTIGKLTEDSRGNAMLITKLQKQAQAI